MNIDFTGKKAIVCGGSRGIGRAIALGFAAAGGDVSICARDAKGLEATRAEIAKSGHKAHAAAADLSKGDTVRGYVRDAIAALAASTCWSTTPRPSARRMTTRVGPRASPSTCWRSCTPHRRRCRR
jgi:NAD(P)-dependent dehydrogenase (short-subunit alcohol dehydrogenase family)